jgi:hypothetical protein
VSEAEDMDPPAVSQPGLFPAAVQASWESHLVELVDGAGGDRARYTGRTVEKDRELVDALMRGLIGGLGVKALSRLHRVSPQTVRGIRDRAEKAGRLGPYKERMLLKLSQASEDCVDVLLEGLADGTVKAGAVSIPLGIIMDKRAMLDGAPSLIIEHRHELSIDLLKRQIEEARASAVDIQSTVYTSKEAIFRTNSSDVATVVADAGSGSVERGGEEAARTGAADAQKEALEEGGGGASATGGTGGSMDSRMENFEQRKEP